MSRSPEALVEAVIAVGGSVKPVAGGRMSLTGPVPEDLVAEIRGVREEFLDAWGRLRADRYLRQPPAAVPLRKSPPKFNASTRRRVERYALTQGESVAAWVRERAQEYREARSSWSQGECLAAAGDDLLRWQMERHSDPVAVLLAFDESMEGFKP